MKYYVVADPHGFYTELRAALEEQGFFTDPAPHQLIICGDLFDRGLEARKLQDFVLGLLRENRVILIRGNHEDLALSLLNTWHRDSFRSPHHLLNGTVDTVCQLTGARPQELEYRPEVIGRRFLHSPYIQTIIPAMVDYFETEHYVFVHGWLPIHNGELVRDWRYSPRWDNARWVNGIEAAHLGARVPGKTVVCGHWHSSFGHARYENRPDDHSPYYGPGVIALDASTAQTRRVNCIVLEDEPVLY